MDAYRLLGLAPGATLDDVRVAYHRLAVQHHPDQRPATERTDAEHTMMLINQARAQVLRDIQVRAARTGRAVVQVRVPQQRSSEDHERIARVAHAYVETDRLTAPSTTPTQQSEGGRWRDAAVPGVLAVLVALGFAAGLPIPALLALLGVLVVASLVALF